MEYTSATSKRPTLYNPQEYVTIKSIYFKDDAYRKEFCEDPIENLERQESRHRNLKDKR